MHRFWTSLNYVSFMIESKKNFAEKKIECGELFLKSSSFRSFLLTSNVHNHRACIFSIALLQKIKFFSTRSIKICFHLKCAFMNNHQTLYKLDQEYAKPYQYIFVWTRFEFVVVFQMCTLCMRIQKSQLTNSLYHSSWSLFITRAQQLPITAFEIKEKKKQ